MTAFLDRRTAGLLAESSAVQALGTMAVLTIPAIAPEVAAALGVAPSLVGGQISLVYLAAALSSLGAGSLVGALGPWRTGQVAMLLAAAGTLLASLPHLAALALGSIAIGAGYGLLNPASSDLLARHSPPGRRNLVFAIKQTGVPLGGVGAGLIAPPLALAAGWAAPLWLVAGAAVLLAAASQPARAGWDADRPRAVRPGGQSGGRTGWRLLDGFRLLAGSRALPWLAGASFCFSAVQLSVVAFLVVVLVEEAGLGLVAAGSVLAAAQVAGAVGRIAWGAVADRLRDGMLVLLGVALLMTAGAVAVTGLSAAWPVWLIAGAFMLLGATAVGWNGVYLSELARLSPAHAVGAVTGSAMCVTFAGVVMGPAAFSALHDWVGGYGRSYWLLAALALAGGGLIAAARRAAGLAKDPDVR